MIPSYHIIEYLPSNFVHLWQPYFDTCALSMILPFSLPSILNEYSVPHWNLDTWMNDMYGSFDDIYVKTMPGLMTCFWCNLVSALALNIHAIYLPHSILHDKVHAELESSPLYKQQHENVNDAFLSLVLLVGLILLLVPCSHTPLWQHTFIHLNTLPN